MQKQRPHRFLRNEWKKKQKGWEVDNWKDALSSLSKAQVILDISFLFHLLLMSYGFLACSQSTVSFSTKKIQIVQDAPTCRRQAIASQ